MGDYFKIAIFVVLTMLLVGGLMFLNAVVEDASPFFGKVVTLIGIGLIITVVVALGNAAVNMAPGLIDP